MQGIHLSDPQVLYVGLWYVGVYSDDNVMSSYSMKISKFICMNDCNQNGECQLHSDGINKCNCHRVNLGVT